MRRRYPQSIAACLRTAAWCGVWCVATCLAAQGQGAPAGTAGAGVSQLDEILARLEKNVRDFRRSVPNFFCREEAVSTMEPGPGSLIVLREDIDSIFRVRRAMDEQGVRLDESRAVKTVNGKVQPGEDVQMNSPMAVFGVFSTGLDLVSSTSKACFRYRLEPVAKRRENAPLVIDFDELPDAERDPHCMYPRKISGKAYVDPTLMRVVRMESKTRGHEMYGGLKGTWDWRIDYEPVPLGEKTFWLPARIRSKEVADREQPSANNAPIQMNAGRSSGRGGTTASGGSNEPLTYGLNARYSDYHLLHVTAKIMTETGKEIETAPEAVGHP